MRQCVIKKTQESRSEVQQIRSLALQVKECKLTKAVHAQIYCLIAVDSCFVARTRPMNPVTEDQHCVFDENYRFE